MSDLSKYKTLKILNKVVSKLGVVVNTLHWKLSRQLDKHLKDMTRDRQNRKCVFIEAYCAGYGYSIRVVLKTGEIITVGFSDTYAGINTLLHRLDLVLECSNTRNPVVTDEWGKIL